jgi:hypothetical protein
MYKRKTKDVYIIQGWYSAYGWEDLTEEETWKGARGQLKCYNENEPLPHRIVKRREKLEIK